MDNTENFATCFTDGNNKTAIYLVLNDINICKEVLNTLQMATRTEANKKSGNFDRVAELATLTSQFEKSIVEFEGKL